MATNLVAEIAELLSPNIVSSIASAFGLNSGKAAPSAPPPQQIPDVGGGLATYCGIPGQTGPTGQTQSPMGDIFGQILRDLLSGKGGQLKPASLAGGMGSAVLATVSRLVRVSIPHTLGACKRCWTVSLRRRCSHLNRAQDWTTDFVT